MVALSNNANEQTTVLYIAASPSYHDQVVLHIYINIDFGALTNGGVGAVTGGISVIKQVWKIHVAILNYANEEIPDVECLVTLLRPDILNEKHAYQILFLYKMYFLQKSLKNTGCCDIRLP